jgi:putative DNA methylase
MPESRKKLIEVALPLDAINRESAREKSIRHGHPSTLHLWWARRPLAACRAVLFASIVDDPSSRPEEFPSQDEQEVERQRLFRLIEELVRWENSDSPAILEAARKELREATNGNLPPVLDPFCGGGSIPLEAVRLGLDARASDLNPVAVLITKALVEIPEQFFGRPPSNPESQGALGSGAGWRGAEGLAEDVRYYGRWMREQAQGRIGHLYPKATLINGGEATVIAWLWTRTVRCPNPACGRVTPLLTSFVLVSKKGHERYLQPLLDSGRIHFCVSDQPPLGDDPSRGYKRGMSGVFECAHCGTVTTRAYVSDEATAGRLGVMQTAVVAEGSRTRIYLPPDAAPVDADSLPDPPADELNIELAPNPRDVWCRNFGLTTAASLFTDRQLVALTTFAGLVDEARVRVLHDSNDAAYANAVVTYLALAVSSLADDLSSLVSWRSGHGTGATRSTFARQALPMVWDFAEANPFAGSAGDLALTTAGIAEIVRRTPLGPQATVRQLDATHALPTGPMAITCTDPPYYDNIGYADLSDFFYVWLRRMVGAIYPDVFSTLATPKSQELVASPYRFDGDRHRADQFFEDGLREVFSRIRDAQHPGYPLTLFYAFKQAESGDGSLASTGWDKMLTGLLDSGYAVTGTWPMRTERRGRSVSIGTSALASSIVLVCRPRAVDAPIATRRELVSALRAELPEALRTLQHGNIAPVDLAQAAIGPGMAVFSRYAKVLEADGTTMTVRAALGLINQALDEILAEQEGDFDSDTRFAITWFEQRGFDEGPYGEADVLARAKDTSTGGLVEAGILESRGGKVRLLRRDELDDDWDPATDRRPTVWEATHHLARRLEDGGEDSAASLLRRLGGLGATARDLAYRLYTTSDRKGWAQDALAYNALVVAWPEIARRVAGTPEAEAQQVLEI